LRDEKFIQNSVGKHEEKRNSEDPSINGRIILL
jgi:hypothetical protein